MSNKVFICKSCNKNFPYKSHYLRHVNKKNECIEKIDKNNMINVLDLRSLNKLLDNVNHRINNRNKKTTDVLCGFCNKEYSNRNNLKRHLNQYCNEKKIILAEKEKILYQYNVVKNIKNDYEHANNSNKKLNEEETVKEVIENEKKETHQNTIINNNTTNNNININNNVNVNNVNILVNNFGKEDISHLTKKDFINYINKMYDGLTKLIEDCHFSDKNKNNFNVYLTSMRNEFANIYQNDTWILKDVEDVIYQLKDDKLAILDQKAEEYNDDKLKNTIETFKQRLYSNTEAEKNLNKNIKLVMVNNSEKIIAQKKKSKKIKK